MPAHGAPRRSPQGASLLIATVEILIADDDVENRDALVAVLRHDGFAVDVATGGPEALERFRARQHGLVILGSTLPGVHAVDLCRMLRSRSTVPIIVVRGSDDEGEVVRALEAGADDCLVKPLRPREFVARVRAAIRRAPPAPPRDDRVLEVAGVRLDPVGFEVVVRGARVELTLKEFEVLHLLMANAGRTLTRRLLVERVWREENGEGKSLDTHVRRLRAKIEGDASDPALIVTIRGVGYRFTKQG